MRFKGAINGVIKEFEIDDTIEEIPVEFQIEELKQKLSDTDYIACKIAEGAATIKEYAKELQQRQEWREEINRLERSEAQC